MIHLYHIDHDSDWSDTDHSNNDIHANVSFRVNNEESHDDYDCDDSDPLSTILIIHSQSIHLDSSQNDYVNEILTAILSEIGYMNEMRNEMRNAMRSVTRSDSYGFVYDDICFPNGFLIHLTACDVMIGQLSSME